MTTRKERRDKLECARDVRAKRAVKPPSGEVWDVYRIRKAAWLSANRGASAERSRAELGAIRRELGLE